MESVATGKNFFLFQRRISSDLGVRHEKQKMFKKRVY
jgi:hypothetical protein